ncbi:MAG: hypothetical protein LBM23_09100 [Propionibacteriaceae bacterium]|jgi:hypothetical protein|nr:hypothetical protein [Propionibacteriaceae bacterium]
MSTETMSVTVSPGEPAPDALEERLRDPATRAALVTLLDNIDTIAGMVEVMQSFMARSSEIVDNVAGMYHEVTTRVASDPAVERGTDSFVKLGQQVLPIASRMADANVAEQLAHSRAIEPEFVELLFRIFDGIRDVQADMAAAPPKRRITMLRLPLMMRDRDFNRGIDYVLRVVRKVGVAVKETGTTAYQRARGQER